MKTKNLREHWPKLFGVFSGIFLVRKGWGGGKNLVDEMRNILDENIPSVKYELLTNKLPTYQRKQNNSVKNHLRRLLGSTCS